MMQRDEQRSDANGSVIVMVPPRTHESSRKARRLLRIFFLWHHHPLPPPKCSVQPRFHRSIRQANTLAAAAAAAAETTPQSTMVGSFARKPQQSDRCSERNGEKRGERDEEARGRELLVDYGGSAFPGGTLQNGGQLKRARE